MERLKAFADMVLGFFGLETVDNFEQVVKHAWSFRLLVVAGLLTGMEAGLPYIDQWIYIPRWAMALLTMAVICAAFIARTVAQNNLKSKDTQEDEHQG